MPPTPCHGNDSPTIEPDHIRPAGHHRTHHHAGFVPLDRPRGQLSHRAALFLYGDPVGHAVLGLLPSACVLPTGCLPAGWRCSRRHQGWQGHPWPGSLLLKFVWQAGPPGLAFFTLSLVSVQARRSFPLRVAQVVRSAAEKAASKAKVDAQKSKTPRAPRRRGRLPGSLNKAKAHVTLTPELRRIKAMIDAVLHLSARVVPFPSLVLDGHFGNHHALHMAQQSHLPLIAKLRCDAALYLPYTGPYAGRGPRRKYGAKVEYAHIPAQYLQETTVEGHIQTQIYQMQLLYRECAQPLNVVILVKTNLRTHAHAHIVLFSSDLTLAYPLLIDYYAWRFPLEFNSRDAKQYGGLEDFMHVTPTGVTHAANVSLFMVNAAYRLRKTLHPCDPNYSVLDLKADCRGYQYVEETIQRLPDKPAPVLLAKILHQVACLGRIHAVQPAFSVF